MEPAGRTTAASVGRVNMAVYVDDMRATFGRMKMCHMIADSSEELLAMADRIGVARRWLQKAGTHHEHFDIALSKRALAVAAGAIEIDRMELGRMLRARRPPIAEVQP
jgi:hypothetical protein